MTAREAVLSLPALNNTPKRGISMPENDTLIRIRQPREHAVPCKECRKPTFEPDAICYRHDDRTAA